MNRSRRRFLIASGWIAAGATVIFTSGCSLPVMPTVSDDVEEDAASWMQLLPDGKVRFYIGKAEMGQGVMTALTQIVAEELSVPMETVIPVLADTTQIPPVRMTVGSETVEMLYLPLRQAAADLLAALRLRAAVKYAVDETEVHVADDGFVLANSGEKIKLSSLVSNDALVIRSGRGTLKPVDQLSEIGKPRPRLDVPMKLNGSALFAHDIQLPGMLYGKVVHPPALGAKLEEVDSHDARQIEGVIEVVESVSDGFVGVVCETPEVADAAMQSLKLTWSIPKRWQQQEIETLLDPQVLEESGVSSHSIVDEGNAEEGRKDGLTSVHRKCWTPFAAHAPMETPAGVAHVTDEKVELWVGSQDVFFHQAQTAKLTNMPKEKVIVHPTMIGGAFGGKVYVEAAEEAVILSQSVKRPVKVIWSREESFHRGYYRTASSHLIDAGVDSKGKVSYWHHKAASGPVIFSPAMLPPVAQWATSFMRDKGGVRGLVPPYNFANQQIEYWDQPLPIPTGPWRGLNACLNAFAIETTLDVLAKQAQQDPLAFRIAHLSSDQYRLTQVLNTAAEDSGWGSVMPRNHGRGIACGVYKGVTYVAVVAEVEVVGSDIYVKRLVCAHDCGLVINPDGVRAQIEGNLLWGCGTALREELTVVDGRVSADNFHNYDIVRYDEAPAIEIHLVEDRSIRPSGVGEPALMPTPAAIANAVANVTGLDVTRLPIRLDNLVS